MGADSGPRQDGGDVKPAPFRYERAETAAEAIDFLAAEGERAKALAGGQSLVALMNMRLARPEVLLDLGRLEELRFQEERNGAIEIGAMTTQADLEQRDDLQAACPLLADAMPYVGHAAIRNRGTVGGSIAHADPAAELPVVLQALAGSVVLSSSRGDRTVDAAEFFKGFLATATEPDELLRSVSFPRAEPGTSFAFEEFSRRPGDFALTSVACVIQHDAGTVDSARVALGGVAGVPVLVEGLDGLVGVNGDEAAERAARLADATIDPVSDIHGSADYRRHLTRELVKRAFRRALDDTPDS